ncbi:hypothetical protein [Bacillus salacetis]|uniref:hypothetical protein n=1 Tax=Bacillus salacetis TaxID=2315464 RepID=UPI001F0B8A07|nr:hypothetical protein [Bacillus salacetis]
MKRNAVTQGDIDTLGIANPLTLVPELPNQIFQETYESIQLKPLYKSASMLEIVLYERSWHEWGMENYLNPTIVSGWRYCTQSLSTGILFLESGVNDPDIGVPLCIKVLTFCGACQFFNWKEASATSHASFINL